MPEHPISRAFGIILALSAGSAATAGVDWLYGRWQLHKALVEASGTLNKQLQQYDNGFSHAIGTTVSFTTLVYTFRVEQTITANDISNGEAVIRRNVCAASSGKLVDSGASLVYRYQDASGRQIGEIDINSCPPH